MNAALEAELTHLSNEEKLELVGKLWSMIEADALPVPPEVIAELDRRRAKLEGNPESALTLDELMARVKRRL